MTVWAIIKETCELAGIPIPTIKELEDLLDEKTYEIYDKGLTCTINQADSEFATSLVEIYKPRSVAEMSAFVAIIRPGCASLLQDFIHRLPYTTGVEELDELLKEGNHRMIYQELIMKYLIWLGIAEKDSYDIIKKIAKKKFKEAELEELEKVLLAGWNKQVGKEEGFFETWEVVKNAAKYSFNACVAGDTVILRPNGETTPTVEWMYNFCDKGNYGKALSMYEDGKIRENKIIDIRFNDIKNIYRVITESGHYLDCTSNHKFPTPNGKVKLCNLSVGDLLYVMDFSDSSREIHSTTLEKIISIEYLRTDKTYDVEMAAPAHTYVSESGLVTSNSHSLAYGYDSLYGAYLKSHYPLEYYTVVFNYYDGDSERTARLFEEIKHFGISMNPAKFRMSKAGYTIAKEDNSIYKGIGSIKNLNTKVADQMYQMRNAKFVNFIELLYALKKQTEIEKDQLEILIKLDFFSEFGEANVLLKQYELFEKLAGKKTLKKENLSELGISEGMAANFCEKETEKKYNGLNSRGLLMELAGRVQASPMTLKEKVKAQVEYLGYVDIVDEKYRGVLAILDVDTKYSPKIKVYSLKNGTILNLKISKTIFNKNKLEVGDIILVQGQKTKNKMTRTSDGKFEEVEGEREVWLTKYRKI